VQIQQRLQQVLQREIALVDLFKYTTVSTLSRALHVASEPSDEPGSSAGTRRTERSSKVREQMLLRKQSRTQE
jgi:hypothetical protein